MAAFMKGSTGRTVGRPEGSKGKDGAALREIVIKAMDELGGPTYLVEVGRKDPKTFCALFGKLLPKESSIDITSTGSQKSLVELFEELNSK